MRVKPIGIAGLLLVIIFFVSAGTVLTLAWRCRGGRCALPPPGFRPSGTVGSFAECEAAGYPLLQSYPRRCRTPDGRSFTEDVGNEAAKADLIYLDSPRPNALVSSPLVVFGSARGKWYFEASFPVKLEDSTGKVVAQQPAQAQGEWMTPDFVPFLARLEFTPPATATGTLVLEKDNPAGLPEQADSLRIPVRFR